MVREHGPEHPSQWAAITSIASKFGCTAETLRNWVRQAERDSGQPGGLTTDERKRLKELERDNRELKRANEILRKASAYFAQAELDRTTNSPARPGSPRYGNLGTSSGNPGKTCPRSGLESTNDRFWRYITSGPGGG